jgi:mRNA interferase RelE/StbE
MSAASCATVAPPANAWPKSYSRTALDNSYLASTGRSSTLRLLERDPHIGHALRGRLHGLRSLRVGTYRLIYQLSDDGQTVRVAAIRHRAIAYRTDPR